MIFKFLRNSKSNKDVHYKTNTLVRFTRTDKQENFGDKLSEVITNLMLYNRGLFWDDEVIAPRRMLAIGSILHFSKPGDVVWGAGINGKVDNNGIQNQLDIRAVRGPLTKKILQSKNVVVPDVFGDPALLLLKLLPTHHFESGSDQYELSVLPNLNDTIVFDAENYVNKISPLEHWKTVCNKIANSRVIVSSSLHGIILGELFGCDVVPLLPQKETLLKYEDYFEGTGRRLPYFYPNLSSALRGNPIDKAEFNVDELENSFPYDLWFNS